MSSLTLVLIYYSYEPAIYEYKWSFGYVFYIRKYELKHLCIVCQLYEIYFYVHCSYDIYVSFELT